MNDVQNPPTISTHAKLVEWFGKNVPNQTECIGTTLFLTAAMFMTEGIARGMIYDDDVLWWVRGAWRSNSYGEAEETYTLMKHFEGLLVESVED